MHSIWSGLLQSTARSQEIQAYLHPFGWFITSGLNSTPGIIEHSHVAPAKQLLWQPQARSSSVATASSPFTALENTWKIKN